MPPEYRLPLLVAVTVLPALLISVTVVALLRRWAPRLGLLDRPNQRKVHTTPIPLGGGIGIWAGWLGTLGAGAAFVLAARSSPSLAAWLPAWASQHLSGAAERLDMLAVIVGCGTILMIVGLIDDRYGLGWKLRLGIQFAVAAGCVSIPELRLTAFIPLPFVTVPLTVVWIVAMINAFNMLDNMDGLSGGIGTIVGGLLAASLLLSADPSTGQPQLFVAGFVLTLVGGLIGFLVHNRPPARIFMGDAGSYLIGFVLSIATLLGTYAGQQDHPLAVLTPLFLMAVPMYDMLTVIAIRLNQGRSPFEADRNHLSHRLVDLGFTKPRAVAVIHLLTATCGLGALLLARTDLPGALLVAAMVGCVLALIGLIELTARRRLKAAAIESAERVASPLGPAVSDPSGAGGAKES